MMNNKLNYVAMVVAGAVIGAAGYAIFGGAPDVAAVAPTAKSEPLYWVAPMDPNYKRDKPGKSPMGMDLIPVFAEDGAAADGPGTIRISPDVENNLGVRTSVVTMGLLNSEIKTVGYVQFDEDQLVHIHPRVEGWIEKLYVKAEGDPVRKDGPLYAIYSPNLVNAQEELVLALNRNSPALVNAAEDRLRALQVPAVTISALRQSKKVSQTVTIFAPQSGVVNNLNVREGFFVQPGTTMMSIGVLDEVWVTGEVFERQASQVKAGDPVSMTLDYLPGRSWQGHVDYVYPMLNPKTRTAQVRVRLANSDHLLRPGMFAQLAIQENAAQAKLLVPREAVIRTGNQDRVVLALGDGKFKSIEVRIGHVADNLVEILGGLSEGEKIVTSAQFLLDSESSKNSDFKRMNRDPDVTSLAQSVWVEATINSLMPGHKMVNLTHKEISEWDWPVMTMDFTVDDAVDFTSLKAGMTLQVKISKSADNHYLISEIQIPDTQPETTQNPDPAKPGMGEEGVDHSQMDHSQMDHSQMNGEAMESAASEALPEHQHTGDMEPGHD
ncbi:MAG: efflux RND transporter periplasmic adaptor subunit [Gammaproteobacteria bacterium]|nr:efflux RND transporter periplasmic adaptor subunit [Gammaproteobacteria bacterium]